MGDFTAREFAKNAKSFHRLLRAALMNLLGSKIHAREALRGPRGSFCTGKMLSCRHGVIKRTLLIFEKFQEL